MPRHNRLQTEHGNRDGKQGLGDKGCVGQPQDCGKSPAETRQHRPPGIGISPFTCAGLPKLIFVKSLTEPVETELRADENKKGRGNRPRCGVGHERQPKPQNRDEDRKTAGLAQFKELSDLFRQNMLR